MDKENPNQSHKDDYKCDFTLYRKKKQQGMNTMWEEIEHSGSCSQSDKQKIIRKKEKMPKVITKILPVLAAVIVGLICCKYVEGPNLSYTNTSSGIFSKKAPYEPASQSTGFVDSPKEECFAPFTVNASPTSSCYVSMTLHDDTDKDYSVFVNAGDSVKVSVPLGSYDMYYCTGTTWYGPEHLFGTETSFYKANDVFDFTQDENGYNGHIVTLQSVLNGNLHTNRIGESKFPK